MAPRPPFVKSKRPRTSTKETNYWAVRTSNSEGLPVWQSMCTALAARLVCYKYLQVVCEIGYHDFLLCGITLTLSMFTMFIEKCGLQYLAVPLISPRFTSYSPYIVLQICGLVGIEFSRERTRKTSSDAPTIWMSKIRAQTISLPALFQ